MDLTETKAVVLVLLGLIKLLSGLAPLVLTKILKKKNQGILKKFIGIVLCFGGGVLLSTVFIHMVTEVRESLERATTMGMIPVEMEFPFAELLICMGFLLILLIESVVHKFFGHSHSPGGSEDIKDVKDFFVSVEDVRFKIPRVGLDNKSYDSDEPKTTTRSSIHPNKTVSNNDKSNILSSKSNMSKTSDSKFRRTKLVSSVRSFLVVLALSIHSIFEGMAIGLEETESGVWKLFLAVAIHSTAIVFCIGTEMISTGTKKAQFLVYMTVLSLVTPLGVLLGILVTVHMETAQGAHVLVVGVLQGLAGGTLLYITFFEVLARENLAKYGMSGLMGALTVMIGFTAMAAMEAAAGGHSHGGHGGHGGHGDHGGHGGHEGQVGYGGHEGHVGHEDHGENEEHGHQLLNRVLHPNGANFDRFGQIHHDNHYDFDVGQHQEEEKEDEDTEDVDKEEQVYYNVSSNDSEHGERHHHGELEERSHHHEHVEKHHERLQDSGQEHEGSHYGEQGGILLDSEYEDDHEGHNHDEHEEGHHNREGDQSEDDHGENLYFLQHEHEQEPEQEPEHEHEHGQGHGHGQEKELEQEENPLDSELQQKEIHHDHQHDHKENIDDPQHAHKNIVKNHPGKNELIYTNQ